MGKDRRTKEKEGDYMSMPEGHDAIKVKTQILFY